MHKIHFRPDRTRLGSRRGNWKCRTWTMQDLENDGPIRMAGKCKNWKMTDQMVGLENAGPGKWRTKSQVWKCRTWKLTDQIAELEIARPGKWRTTSQGVKNAGPTKMTEQSAGLTIQDQWLGGKTLHFVANITNILSWNYLEQVMYAYLYSTLLPVYDFLLARCSNFCRITHRLWKIWCERV